MSTHISANGRAAPREEGDGRERLAFCWKCARHNPPCGCNQVRRCCLQTRPLNGLLPSPAVPACSKHGANKVRRQRGGNHSDLKSLRLGIKSRDSIRGIREAGDDFRGRVQKTKPEYSTVIRFLKNRLTKFREPLQQSALGPLEISIMDVLWERGESNVRDVVENLDRRLAYTTVMTTLDRLFKKGLLDRHKLHRSFIYLPKLSREEWEQRRAGELVAGFLAGPEPSRELLLSCFLDVIGEHDAALLDVLEKKIRMRRKELFGRRGS